MEYTIVQSKKTMEYINRKPLSLKIGEYLAEKKGLPIASRICASAWRPRTASRARTPEGRNIIDVPVNTLVPHIGFESLLLRHKWFVKALET